MALRAMPDERYIKMRAKFDSHCAECEGDIDEGDSIIYDTKDGKAYCEECGKEYQ